MGGSSSRGSKFEHGDLVARSQCPLSEKYELAKELGAGAQGTTYLVRLLAGGEERVAKESNDMTPEGRSIFLEEFDRVKGLNHPNCCKLIELIEGRELIDGEWKETIFVISEFARGGDLAQHLQKVIQHGALCEKWISGIFRQAMAGVAYLHSLEMTHNDLKPDNILVMSDFSPAQPTAIPDIVICDFGCAVALNHDNRVVTGDPRYQSPEGWLITMAFLEKRPNPPGAMRDKRCDVWMMGVTLFELLSAGSLPFLYRPCSLEQILQAESFHCLKDAMVSPDELQVRPYCQDVSEDGEDLLRRMLVKDVQHRVTATEVLRHQWFVAGKAEVGVATQSLKFRVPKGKVHAVLLCALAQKVDREHQRDFLAAFSKANKNSSGQISFAEFEDAMRLLQHDCTDARRMFAQASLDGSHLNFIEFMAVTFDWNTLPEGCLDRYLEQLHKQLDVDGDGHVSLKDFCASFLAGVLENEESLRAVFEVSVDADSDGKVSLDELTHFLFTPGGVELPAALEPVVQRSALDILRDSCVFLCSFFETHCLPASEAGHKELGGNEADASVPGPRTKTDKGYKVKFEIGVDEADGGQPSLIKNPSVRRASRVDVKARRISVAQAFDIWQPMAAVEPPKLFFIGSAPNRRHTFAPVSAQLVEIGTPRLMQRHTIETSTGLSNGFRRPAPKKANSDTDSDSEDSDGQPARALNSRSSIAHRYAAMGDFGKETAAGGGVWSMDDGNETPRGNAPRSSIEMGYDALGAATGDGAGSDPPPSIKATPYLHIGPVAQANAAIPDNSAPSPSPPQMAAMPYHHIVQAAAAEQGQLAAPAKKPPSIPKVKIANPYLQGGESGA